MATQKYDRSIGKAEQVSFLIESTPLNELFYGWITTLSGLLFLGSVDGRNTEEELLVCDSRES